MNSNQSLQPDLHLQTYPEKPFLYWDSLSRLAGSAGLRRYTGLVFVLPLIAAGINAIGWPKLSLPPTLTLAYIAGLFFLCGILMVQAWCPNICHEGRTADVAKAEGRTKQYIIHHSRETYRGWVKDSPKWANHFLYNLFAYYVPNAPRATVNELLSLKDKPLTTEELFEYCELLVKHPPNFDEAFWHVQWFAAGSRKYKRITAATFLGAGVLFAALTLAFQAVAVLKAWGAHLLLLLKAWAAHQLHC